MRRRRKGPETADETDTTDNETAVAGLRAAAEEHRPDEARIWASVETRMATHTQAPRSPAPWSKVLMTTMVTMAVAAVVSIAAWQLTAGTQIPGAHSAAQPQAVPAPASTSAQATTSVPPSSKAPPPTGKSTGSTTAPVNATATPGPQSYPYWAENDVRLTVERALDKLEVTIRVVRTDRVSATGSWLSLPASDFRISTETTDEAILYRWTLLPGRTVQPGSYVMAAQYNRGDDHDPREDTFVLRSGDVIVSGHF